MARSKRTAIGSVGCSTDRHRGNNCPSSRKCRVLAQRKFAQRVTTVDEPSRVESQYWNRFVHECQDLDRDPFLPVKGALPKTEDFIKFLCYRGSESVPDDLRNIFESDIPVGYSTGHVPRLTVDCSAEKLSSNNACDTSATTAVANLEHRFSDSAFCHEYGITGSSPCEGDPNRSVQSQANLSSDGPPGANPETKSTKSSPRSQVVSDRPPIASSRVGGTTLKRASVVLHRLCNNTILERDTVTTRAVLADCGRRVTRSKRPIVAEDFRHGGNISRNRLSQKLRRDQITRKQMASRRQRLLKRLIVSKTLRYPGSGPAISLSTAQLTGRPFLRLTRSTIKRCTVRANRSDFVREQSSGLVNTSANKPNKSVRMVYSTLYDTSDAAVENPTDSVIERKCASVASLRDAGQSDSTVTRQRSRDPTINRDSGSRFWYWVEEQSGSDSNGANDCDIAGIRERESTAEKSSHSYSPPSQSRIHESSVESVSKPVQHQQLKCQREAFNRKSKRLSRSSSSGKFLSGCGMSTTGILTSKSATSSCDSPNSTNIECPGTSSSSNVKHNSCTYNGAQGPMRNLITRSASKYPRNCRSNNSNNKKYASFTADSTLRTSYDIQTTRKLRKDHLHHPRNSYSPSAVSDKKSCSNVSSISLPCKRSLRLINDRLVRRLDISSQNITPNVNNDDVPVSVSLGSRIVARKRPASALPNACSPFATTKEDCSCVNKKTSQSSVKHISASTSKNIASTALGNEDSVISANKVFSGAPLKKVLSVGVSRRASNPKYRSSVVGYQNKLLNRLKSAANVKPYQTCGSSLFLRATPERRSRAVCVINDQKIASAGRDAAMLEKRAFTSVRKTVNTSRISRATAGCDGSTAAVRSTGLCRGKKQANKQDQIKAQSKPRSHRLRTLKGRHFQSNQSVCTRERCGKLEQVTISEGNGRRLRQRRTSFLFFSQLLDSDQSEISVSPQSNLSSQVDPVTSVRACVDSSYSFSNEEKCCSSDLEKSNLADENNYSEDPKECFHQLSTDIRTAHDIGVVSGKTQVTSFDRAPVVTNDDFLEQVDVQFFSSNESSVPPECLLPSVQKDCKNSASEDRCKSMKVLERFSHQQESGDYTGRVRGRVQLHPSQTQCAGLKSCSGRLRPIESSLNGNVRELHESRSDVDESVSIDVPSSTKTDSNTDIAQQPSSNVKLMSVTEVNSSMMTGVELSAATGANNTNSQVDCLISSPTAVDPGTLAVVSAPGLLRTRLRSSDKHLRTLLPRTSSVGGTVTPHTTLVQLVSVASDISNRELIRQVDSPKCTALLAGVQPSSLAPHSNFSPLPRLIMSPSMPLLRTQSAFRPSILATDHANILPILTPAATGSLLAGVSVGIDYNSARSTLLSVVSVSASTDATVSRCNTAGLSSSMLSPLGSTCPTASTANTKSREINILPGNRSELLHSAAILNVGTDEDACDNTGAGRHVATPVSTPYRVQSFPLLRSCTDTRASRIHRSAPASMSALPVSRSRVRRFLSAKNFRRRPVVGVREPPPACGTVESGVDEVSSNVSRPVLVSSPLTSVENDSLMSFGQLSLKFTAARDSNLIDSSGGRSYEIGTQSDIGTEAMPSNEASSKLLHADNFSDIGSSSTSNSKSESSSSGVTQDSKQSSGNMALSEISAKSTSERDSQRTVSGDSIEIGVPDDVSSAAEAKHSLSGDWKNDTTSCSHNQETSSRNLKVISGFTPTGKNFSRRRGDVTGSRISQNVSKKSTRPVVTSSSSCSHNPSSSYAESMSEVPVFRPSEQQFSDPFAYLQSIWPIVQQHGLCRIIPPANFQIIALNGSKNNAGDLKQQTFCVWLNKTFLENVDRASLEEGWLCRLVLVHAYVTHRHLAAPMCDICSRHLSPECGVDDGMRFVAYNHYVHKMYRRWGENFRSLMALRQHLEQQNIELDTIPQVGGVEVDLVSLYNVVCQQKGGLNAVIANNSWSAVAQQLHLLPRNNNNSRNAAAAKLDQIYCRYLLSYTALTDEERKRLADHVDAEWYRCQRRRETRLADCRRTTSPSTPSTSSDDSCSDHSGLSDYDDEDDDDSAECIVKGKSTSLASFYRVSRNFSSAWYGENQPDSSQVEHDYWALATEGDQHVCVYSGSVNCSDPYDCGFLCDGKSATSFLPWNLKVLANSQQSILSAVGQVPGVTLPTLHISMLFSTGCWYSDPHQLPWIEYLHTGTEKIWYCVPASDSERMRSVMGELLPGLIRHGPVWLPSDTAMIPPAMLIDKGIHVRRCVQQPGEFLVAASAAFVSSICTGYTLSESVLFAPVSWLQCAPNIFRQLRRSREPSMFALSRLLLGILYMSMSGDKGALSCLLALNPVLRRFSELEWRLINKLRKLGVVCEFRLLKLSLASSHQSIPDLQWKKQDGSVERVGVGECEVCNTSFYTNLLVTKSQSAYYCLHHGISLIRRKQLLPSELNLLYMYTEVEYGRLLCQLEERIKTLQTGGQD